MVFYTNEHVIYMMAMALICVISRSHSVSLQNSQISQIAEYLFDVDIHELTCAL